MSIEAHIKQLELKHQTLDEKLNDLRHSPSTSNVRIAELKRQKLQIKDQIRRISSDNALH
jgi:hypothetical protein